MPVHVPEEHKHRLPLSAVPKRKAVQNARSAELAAEREEELDRAREEAFKQGVSEAEGVVAEAKARLDAMAEVGTKGTGVEAHYSRNVAGSGGRCHTHQHALGEAPRTGRYSTSLSSTMPVSSACATASYVRSPIQSFRPARAQQERRFSSQQLGYPHAQHTHKCDDLPTAGALS